MAAGPLVPGLNPTQSRPRRPSAGPSPAFISEDLPPPEGPARTNSAVRSKRSTRASTSAPRPWKTSWSSARYGASPFHGQARAASRAWCSDANEGSWSRIRRSSSTRPDPGSRPSSRPSMRRAERMVASASACRPQRYWAKASIAHRRSRQGSSPTSTVPSSATCRCSPESRRACRRSSSAVRRDSTSLATSRRPGSHSSSASKGEPRHSASAWPRSDAARSGEPDAARSRARVTRWSKLSRSRSTTDGSSRYPTGVVAMA